MKKNERKRKEGRGGKKNEGRRERRKEYGRKKKIREKTGKDLFPQFERDCKAQVHFALPSPQYAATASVASYAMTMNMFL